MLVNPSNVPPSPMPARRLTWGISTSSYQIEGAANEDGRGPSIWDSYCRQAGRVANGDTGDVACDHYHRYRDDIGLIRNLGVDAYRFSVAWPRVLPKGRGPVNAAGLAFYDRLIDELLGAGIEPWLCLYHWDLPQALDDLGGWTNRDCALWFADYAALVARHYGDRVKRYATFNEPSVFTLLGFCLGGQAPGIADRTLLLRAIHHVNLGHGGAIDMLRANVPQASLGIVHNRQPCRPADGAPENAAAAQQFDAYWNGAFPGPQLLACYPPSLAEAVAPHVEPGDLARICRPIDWFGLNHYSPIYVKPDDRNPLGIGFGDVPPEVRRPASAGRSSPMRFAARCSNFTDAFGFQSTSWKTAQGPWTGSTRMAASAIRRGSTTSRPIPAPCSRLSRPVPTCAAISSGRCSIISNGHPDTASGSGSSMWITQPSGGFQKESFHWYSRLIRAHRTAARTERSARPGRHTPERDAMSAIVTLTPNPAIDVSTTVERLMPIRKLRCGPARREPGGGGINVARVVRQLGGEVTAIYPQGGATGQLLSRLVEREQIAAVTSEIAKETREDFSVHETASGQQFRMKA